MNKKETEKEAVAFLLKMAKNDYDKFHWSHYYEIKKLERNVTDAYVKANSEKEITKKIKKLENTIMEQNLFKEFCYEAGKGGKEYFDTLYKQIC